jgi:A/G-specific adenine glycosylase
VLRWYRRHCRDLPWRRTRDPYAIWVAETMLQQTRSETVLRYFDRFLRRFPTVGSLARAPQSAVLTLWSGLGYYSRARHLHLAAQHVTTAHAGRVPANPRALLALPGVGPYTAGALASIAFGHREPVLDGNVARVLARWFGVRGDPSAASIRAKLWKLAADLVSPRTPGDWNQALMELGATVCTPRAPRCERCPVGAECFARRSACIDEVPGRTRRRAPERVRRAALVVERRGRVLLVRHDDGRLLRGLWEFPAIDAYGREKAERAAGRLLARLGARGRPLESHGRIVHTVVHRRIETTVFRVRMGSRVTRDRRSTRWFRPGELSDVPLSSLGLRIAAQLGSPASRDRLRRSAPRAARGMSVDTMGAP